MKKGITLIKMPTALKWYVDLSAKRVKRTRR